MKTQRRFPRFLDDQRAFFDALITEEWATYNNPVWDATRKDEVAWLLRAAPAERILNVGCGCGYQDVLMAANPRVTAVTAIDYSPQSVAAAERAYPHPKVRRAEADLFQWPDGGYDLVVSFQVIEHLRAAEAFLRVCAEKTRPGGHVAVFTPNAARLENRWSRRVGHPLRLLDPQHFREFTAPELTAMAAGAGLSLAESRVYGLWVPGLRGGLHRCIVWVERRWPALACRYGNQLAMVFKKPDPEASVR